MRFETFEFRVAERWKLVVISKHYWVTIVSSPSQPATQLLLKLRPENNNTNENIRSRRNKTGSSVQANGVGSNSSAKMASTTPLNTSSSSSSIPPSSSSSSSSSGKRGGGVHPFHHRPTYAAPTRAQSTVASVGQKLLPDNNNATVALTPGGGSGSIEGVQDRVNRSVFIHAATDAYTLQTKYYYHNYYHYYYHYYLAFLFIPPHQFGLIDSKNINPRLFYLSC